MLCLRIRAREHLIITTTAIPVLGSGFIQCAICFDELAWNPVSYDLILFSVPVKQIDTRSQVQFLLRFHKNIRYVFK